MYSLTVLEKSKIKVSARLCSLWRLEVGGGEEEEGMVLCPSHFLWLPVFLVAASLQSLPLSSHDLLPCLHLFMSSLIRTFVSVFRDHTGNSELDPISRSLT